MRPRAKEELEKGLEALIAKLGYVDAERFIMLVSREPFDYTEWRQEHLQDNMSIRELSNMAMKSVEQ